jgi:hypothetical protein
MNDRPESATAQLKIRVREDMRQKLEDAARMHRWPLNKEISSRLARTLREDEELGGGRTSAILRSFASVIELAEGTTGKNWIEDYQTWQATKRAINHVINIWEPEPPNIAAIRVINRLLEAAEKRLDERVAALRELRLPPPPTTLADMSEAHRIGLERMHSLGAEMLEASTEVEKLRAEREAVATEAKSALIHGIVMGDQLIDVLDAEGDD